MAVAVAVAVAVTVVVELVGAGSGIPACTNGATRSGASLRPASDSDSKSSRPAYDNFPFPSGIAHV